jgi:tRNA pseudouridine32 synthase / 23S rRNA pseudouridine746 synthase
MPDPFDRGAVHPLAWRAAEALQQWLSAQANPAWHLDAPHGGKMFGVLVVRAPDGTLGALRAFSGMLGGSWVVDGFAPPCFDVQRFSAVWSAGEAALNALAADRAALRYGVSAVLATRDRATVARSTEILSQLQVLYVLPNARGEVRALADLFAPRLPPGGAGDCAAPKLLAAAYAQGLQPIALAEFWWGAPPRDGDRRHGAFYAACRGKCGPILSHMLTGVDVQHSAAPGVRPVPAYEPVIVFEDEHLIVVNKPAGLLSVPGKGAHRQDCVAARLHARVPSAPAPFVVHRLDVDTSGLMLVARTQEVFVALQRQFAARTIEKRYVALLDGEVHGEHGAITLPLRVDADDRPRQIHDPVHGKAAITDWRVIARAAGRTRVEFTPWTGRTHQLRVHAAHPLGLNAPIVGDRLYAHEAPGDHMRLHLHAESLRWVHPSTQSPIALTAAAPF